LHLISERNKNREVELNMDNQKKNQKLKNFKKGGHQIMESREELNTQLAFLNAERN